MDELVFQRESLRRALGELIEPLEKAAAAYDPESDFPADDLVAAMLAGGVQKQIGAYAIAVSDRIKQRAEDRKERGS